MDLESIAIDPVAKEDGKWFDYAGGTGDARFKVRSFGSKAYQDAFEEAIKPYRKILAVGGKVPPEKDKAITVRLLANIALVDWENLKAGGIPVAYDAELAFKILMDPKNEKLRRFLVACATDLDNFDEELDKALVGNLSTGSSGKDETAS